jgi:hypothetical protein
MSAALPAPQASDFFNVLNGDVRNLIYGYMTLPGIQNKDAKEWLGYAATCKQAKQEVEAEGVRHLWKYVKDLKTEFEKAGNTLQLPRTINTAADFVGLQELTLITDASPGRTFFDDNSCLRRLLSIAIPNLRLHFTSSNLPANPYQLVSSALLTLRGLALAQNGSVVTRTNYYPWATAHITITWDYRNCTLEDTYEAQKVDELRKELRKRGVKPKAMPKRKHRMIDTLLRQDRDNNAPPTTTQQPLQHTLRGLRFGIVDPSQRHLPRGSKKLTLSETNLFFATNRRFSVGMVKLEGADKCTAENMYLELLVSLARNMWRRQTFGPVEVRYVGPEGGN